MNHETLLNRKRYKLLVGEYIPETCNIEHLAHVYIVDYYTSYRNPQSKEFIREFITGVPFATTIKMLYKILIKQDLLKTYDSKGLVFTKNKIKTIIKHRNILAHSNLNRVVDESFNFFWVNADYEDTNYSFSIPISDFDDSLRSLKDIRNIIVRVTIPILEKLRGS